MPITKHDHGKAIVWMNGRRRIVTIRQTHGAGRGWMIHWKDRQPYISTGPIGKGSKTPCRHHRTKQAAIADVESLIATHTGE